ncbi:proline--tRNA ligase [bacterium]|nr:proline--tRNA ligase [bacterium]
MILSKLVGKRVKETPKDAITQSHIFLLRGGYIRPISTGIYSLLPLARRITRKIETIIREEMNRIDGQEILMSVAQPAELWEESNRYQTVGAELLRFTDRNGKKMVLGMTHEEVVSAIVRSEINSYKQLPSMVYQLQTKYRDEARPRAGLLRVREFTMKDAYSFHTSKEDLNEYYYRCHEAYERIFRRIGLSDFVSIQSDSGMMGGAVAHEFMAVAECGEDTIFISEDGNYKANREVATTSLKFEKEEMQPLEKVATPGTTTIEEVAGFLDVKTSQTGKAVFYSDQDGNLIFVVIRGDFEVNEIKLCNHIKASEIEFATEEQVKEIGAVPGYASPMNINTEQVRIVFDPSAVESSNLVVGANESGFHFRNFNFERDMANLKDRVEIVDIANVREGDPDPVNGSPLQMKRGIEIGNIFQLGTKYSETMGCNYLNPNGKAELVVMGCYGIGVERGMASVIEQNFDQYGPIWPFAIAPFEVHICALNTNKEGVGELAEKLYRELQDAGIEVLFDDRNEKAGFAFNDADLIGIPYRLIISPKNKQENKIEFKTRDNSRKEMFDIEETVGRVVDIIKEARQKAASI